MSTRFLVLVVALLLGTRCSLLRGVEPRPTKGVDLNTATVDEIAALPGLSEVEAERIVGERPFASEDEVVRRGLVTHEQLRRFDEQTYVSRPPVGAEPDVCTRIPSPP
jgi:hypothetical protein